MAVEILATDPGHYGAPPLRGNYTDDAYAHLWCAQALASVVGNDEAFGIWNEDIQAALRHLLSREVDRANKAFSAEAMSRRQVPANDDEGHAHGNS